ncbi:MAG TPA: D-2-hydroxyacid dehydrogenase [Steroidobacteraceae bacterium]|nr:D-2-hydroxyacid dehydrogenase [Steroidobacteraceae bacterium]
MAAEPAQIVFLDRGTLPSHVVVRPPKHPHRLISYEATGPDEVIPRIADADVVVANKVHLTGEAIRSAPRLKLIAIAATGTNNVDLAAAQERGILVCNVRDYARHAVPEHTFALILALRRNLLAYRQSVIAGRWEQAGTFCYFDFPLRDLAGDTLGIIGYGALGRAVAGIGKAFGMHVLIAGRKGAASTPDTYTPFDEVLRRSDVISLHAPLTPDTRHLISASEFALMRRKPLLVNTSRGGLVDEEALIAALDSGQIAGAGFDVATIEPAPLHHPLVRLLDRPNFMLTPHVAWASEQATQALADQLIDNIDAFLGGTPRNVVG